MESGAKGCEVVVSGKLRAARAKSMKFTVSALWLLEGGEFWISGIGTYGGSFTCRMAS